MATQTTKKQKVSEKKAVEFLIGNEEFISPIKPMVFSTELASVFVPDYTDVKIVSEGSYATPFVMPDFFLEQAEDMGKFLNSNPLPERN